MIKLIWSDVFSKWLFKLRDRQAYERIAVRLRRLEEGMYGDAKSVGGGISELRIDVGPGYRVYFQQRGEKIILLLCGGDKGSQARDIARARQIAAEFLYDNLSDELDG